MVVIFFPAMRPFHDTIPMICRYPSGSHEELRFLPLTACVTVNNFIIVGPTYHQPNPLALNNSHELGLT